MLKQIPPALEIISAISFSRKQKSTKQSGDENWSGYYFLSSKRQQSIKHTRLVNTGGSNYVFSIVAAP